ncbi:MAG: four helix bundle protein [Bacteroidales bacterium]|nr:four helix bundle protein [Bacteroidales bacterium]
MARNLCRFVYRIISKGEFTKDFTLKNQIRNSSGSSMDNIAEGFGRAGKKEFIHFLSISNASTDEVKSQLYRAFDQNYINNEEFREEYELADKLYKKNGSFINYLNSSDYRGKKFKQS